jgi:lysylphosphatidylglycerol synthetase-like protein (DUF2156 family)
MRSTRSGPRFYPAMWLYGLNAILAVIVSFGIWSQSTSAWITALATAILGFVAAMMVRPLDVSVAAAAFATILTYIGGFRIHLSPESIGALTTVFAMLAAYFTHQNVSPVAGSPTGQPLGVPGVRV